MLNYAEKTFNHAMTTSKYYEKKNNINNFFFKFINNT